MNAVHVIIIVAMDFSTLPKPLQDKIGRLYENSVRPEFVQMADELTAAEKNAIINYLREDMRDGGPNAPLSQNVLIDFGDDEAIARAARAFPDNFDSLRRSIQPKVIPAIAPKMFSNEPYQLLGSDNVTDPPSFMAAGACQDVTQHSPYFSAAVNKWAASWEFYGLHATPEEYRQMMRDWWKANEKYFVAGNYAAVQPGPPLPPQRIQTPTPAPYALPTPFLQETASTPSPKPVPSITPSATKQSTWGLLSAIVILAFAAIGLVVYARTRK